MPFVITRDVLRKIRMLQLEHPQQLTETEAVIAQRICVCALCDNIWIHRTKSTPRRCPACNKSSWDRPLINALVTAAAARNVGAPTPKDTDPGPVPKGER